MSEQQQPPSPQAEPQDNQPLFGIEKIYLKDMSLEVPNAPHVFFEREAPEVEVNIHNEASGLPQEGLFEVVLTVTVTAKIQAKTIFLVEAAQAGIFQIRNVPQQDLEAVLGTLCPNTLLPYAREAVAGLIQRAGFPPVTLQHMNFDLVYQQRMQQLQAQQTPAAAVPQTH
ncbi:MAG TPA: protein-export chaperone SecB [Burkholderiales bacterium]|jgi:preprotein translocase subunit SecB|nr:protein-export chaperone SecB [Burkholderiales bacterium]